MKRMTHCGVVVMCLVGTVVVALGQDNPSGAALRQGLEQRVGGAPNPFGGSPPPPGTVSILGRSLVKSGAMGGANNIPIMAATRDERVRAELGMTQEQVNKLKTIQSESSAQLLLKGAQYAMRFKKMTPDDHAQLEADISKEVDYFTKKIQAVVTPEQLQKSRTIVFQSVGGLDSPVLHVDALETLDLTAEQREKAKQVMDSLEKERLELLEEGLKLAEKAVALGGPNMSPEDREKLRLESRALEARAYASGAKVGDAIRPFLTEEQKAKAVRLIANRPSFLPPLPRQLRERGGADDPGYRPGADSWQPGQALPDGQQPAPRRGFPRQRQEGNSEGGSTTVVE